MTEWNTWAKDAAERALKTGVQTILAFLVADEVSGVMDVPWYGALSAAGLAMLISVGTSFVSTAKGDPSSASLVTTTEGRL